MPRRENPLKDERERQIKEAALRLFSEKGFHDTTVQDIAEEAGLGKGTIYWYWDSKEDLAFSLVEDMLSAFLDLVRRAEEWDLPFREKFRVLVHEASALYREKKDHCRLLWKFRADRHYIFNPDYAKKVTRYYQDIRRSLASIIRKGMEEEEIDYPDSDHLALVVLGVAEGLELEWLENEDFDLEGSLQLVLGNLFSGLSRGSREAKSVKEGRKGRRERG
ncbi:MAG: TetR/AcrR family transcriptional regulator [Candidatus Geothermincolales bacterium]